MIINNLALITVLYNNPQEEIYDWLKTLLQNFYYCPLYYFNVYLINNGEIDYNFDEFQSIPNLNNYRLVYEKNENTGYCGGNNYASNFFQKDIYPKCVFIINPDLYIYNSLVFDWMFATTIKSNAITGIYQDGYNWLTYPAMFPTDKKYDAEELPFVYNYNPKEKYPEQKWKSLPYIDGSLMCLPYSVYKLGFDTDFMPGYFGENALQFKAQLELNCKLIGVPIQKMIKHDSNSDEMYTPILKQEWSKTARNIFYTKYALPNYDYFLRLLV